MKIFNRSTVTYKDHFGDDLMVVNAARTSFAKQSEWDEISCGHDDCGPECVGYTKELKVNDKKLVEFLARENHIIPFAHPQVQFHIQAPIFVARQLVKHQVGGVWSEMSYRYIKPVGIYYPEFWREAPENKKQGSVQGSSVNIKDESPYDGHDYVYDTYEKCWDTYEFLLEKGVCSEQARMVLPLATMSEWTWTGSLLFWSRVSNLRLKEDTQAETREVAEQIDKKIKTIFPISWKAIVGE